MSNINNAPVESWDFDKLVPYEFNHKKHPERQIEMLAKLIQEKGLLNPIIVEEDGTIIAGHGRRLAIERLGWVKVPVRVMRGISKTDAAALRIADNKTVSNEYDTDFLAKELQDIQMADAGLDLSMLGFDQRELDMLVGDVGELDLDIVIEDIDTAVEQHEADIEERAEKADEETVRLDKAFGFKVVPLPSQKVITRFMAEVEAKTGLAGVDALLAHMKGVLAA